MRTKFVALLKENFAANISIVSKDNVFCNQFEFNLDAEGSLSLIMFFRTRKLVIRANTRLLWNVPKLEEALVSTGSR